MRKNLQEKEIIFKISLQLIDENSSRASIRKLLTTFWEASFCRLAPVFKIEYQWKQIFWINPSLRCDDVIILYKNFSQQYEQTALKLNHDGKAATSP